MQAPALIAMTHGAEHIFDFVNPLYHQLFPGREMVGKPLLEALPELRDQPVVDILREVFQTGKAYIGNEMPIVLDKTGKGELETLYFKLIYQATHDRQGKIDGLITYAYEVTELVNARKRIEENAIKVEQILESLPLIAWTTNAAGIKTYMNKQWYAYTGSSTDLSSFKLSAYIHPADVEPTMIQWRESIATGKDFRTRYRLRRNIDQTYQWMLVFAHPLLDEQGNISLWVGTATDIHEEIIREQELFSSNQRLEALNEIGRTISSHLELSTLVQSITDITTRLSGAQFGAFFYNTVSEQGEQKTLYALSGAQKEDFAQFPLPRHTDLFGHTFRGEGILRVDDITQHPLFGNNIPHRGLPKGHLPVKSYMAIPVISRRNQVLGGLFFGHSKAGVFSQEAEELIRDLMPQAAIAIDNAFLFEASIIDRRKLVKTNNQLQYNNDELIKINEDLDNFIYTASHDLKAPINNIEGLMSLLSRKLEKSGSPEESIKGILQMIDNSIIRFKKTVADLAEISKAQKQLDSELEVVDLAQITSDILLDLNFLIEQTGAQIEQQIEQCPKIIFSKKNLKSILYNLLSNAIKYRSQDRMPHIILSCKQQQGYVVVSVQDNGLGLDTKDLPKIFGMFKRLHTHVEGTGIGLYIVKRIIENRGGRIEVESQLGEGTTFSVFFAKEYA